MSNMQEVYDALRSANERGDKEEVRALSAYIESGGLGEEEPEAPELTDYTKAFPNKQPVGTMAGLGFSKVGHDLTTGVQDLYYGITGQDEKREALNAEADKQEEFYNKVTEGSTAATVGNISGEVALGVGTGIAAGGIYKGLKTGQAVAQSGGILARLKALGKAGAVIGAEGAVVEGIRNRGDALDRLVDASEGAAMNLAGQGVVSSFGRGVAAITRRFGARAGKEVLEEAVPLMDEVAESRKLAATQDGGYLLDDVDARVNRDGLVRRDALRKSGGTKGSQLVDRHAQAERDITGFAGDMVDDAAGDGTRQSLNARTDAFADSLREIRADDLSSVDAAYDAWRALPESANVRIDTTSIEAPVRKLLKEAKITADGGVNSKLKALLKQYGVLSETVTKEGAPTTGPLSALGKGASNKTTSLTSVVEPEVPLTAANYEQLIIDINSIVSPTNNPASRTLVRGVRNLLEESKYDLLANSPGASKEAIKLGEAARTARKAFAKKWEQDDIIDKLTSLKAGTEEFREQPVTAVKALMAPKNLNKLKKVKDIVALSSKPEHQRFLADIQAAPLFEALDNALKGGQVTSFGEPIFNNRAFSRTLRQFSDDQLDTLYGSGFTKKLSKAEKAWSFREAKPSFQGNFNPSGTAETNKHLSAAAIRLASTRGGGSDSLATIPLLSYLSDVSKKIADHKDLNLLLAGKLPHIATEVREEAIAGILRDAFPNPQFAKYDSVFSAMARHLSRSYENNQLDD